MNYALGKIKNISLNLVKEILEKDKDFYAVQGIFLENVWQNFDNKSEVYFLIRTDTIKEAKQFIQKMRSITLLITPDANVADFIYLTN